MNRGLVILSIGMILIVAGLGFFLLGVTQLLWPALLNTALDCVVCSFMLYALYTDEDRYI